MAVNVKQIFENVILSESLGNLNGIPDPQAKQVIASLLKDKETRMYAEVSTESSIEKIGSYRDITSFNAELKKFTSLGHRVGAIVFLPDNGRGIVAVITDERYYKEGRVRNELIVRSADTSTSGNKRYGEETTLGKLYNGYFTANLKKAGQIDVYAILRDPKLVAKVNAREDNKSFSDKYAQDGSGMSSFMARALQTTGAKINTSVSSKPMEHSVVDLDKMNFIEVAKVFLNMRDKYKRDREAKIIVKSNGKSWTVFPKTIWFGGIFGLEELITRNIPFEICHVEIDDDERLRTLKLAFDINLKVLATDA